MRVAVATALALAVILGGVARPSGAAESALSISVVGIQAGPYAAKVRWQVSSPATVVAEYGLTEDYGVWTKGIASGRDRAGRTTLPVLEPGYEYRFRLVARTGRERAEETGVFRTAPQPHFVGATATPRGLTVAGQLFFPRMVWRQCPWAYPLSLAAGINVFMGVGCESVSSQLANLRGRALSVTDVQTRTDGPGVVGFHHLDEADARLGRPEDLPSLPPSSKTGRPTFLTLTNHFFSGAAPLPQGRGMYAGMIARAEIVGFNLYPLQIWCRRGTLHAVYEAQRELVALAGGKPTYQWIEAGPMSVCGGLDPSPAIVRAETWLALAGGARGIGWFPDVWQPPVQAEVARLSREIVSLAPVLLGEDGEVSVTPADGPIRAGVKRLNGATYVIAVNSWITPAKATLRVPGLKATSVRVLGGKRTLRVRNGTIVDSLRGLRVRIYVAAPS